jgi:hypothetical protein
MLKIKGKPSSNIATRRLSMDGNSFQETINTTG